MKKFIISLTALFLLSLGICAEPKHAVPERPNIKVEWVDVNGNPQTPGAMIIIGVQTPGKAEAFEIQRKLFPWGWRKHAIIRGDKPLWCDTHPAKRPATYRVRSIVENETSKWSQEVRISR